MKKNNDFSATSLRFSTVYGLSPRMRFDLTVNEFTKDLALGKELVVFGEQFWRPYCHVKDFSKAFITVLKSPSEKVANNVFNVGDNDVEVLLIQRDFVEEHTEKGIFYWDQFVSKGNLSIVEVNSSLTFTITPESLFDVNIVLVRLYNSGNIEDDSLGEVRIVSNYVDDELIFTGFLVSFPAFIITGIVIEGYFNRRF